MNINQMTLVKKIFLLILPLMFIGCASFSDTIDDIIGPGYPKGDIPAFPGAEGFGAYVTGGRGGTVIKVTNLNASGKGSLQAALDKRGPRIIIFNVSGVIKTGKIVIPHGDVTIAGQTAPGAGITIEGRLLGAYNWSVRNIIIRHIRIRPPEFNWKSDGTKFDAVQLSKNSNIILDHVSMSFGVDETLDLYSARNVTVQWCTIEQAALKGHDEGKHNFGLINGPEGGRISVLNNLFAHFNKRAPALSVGPAETINNVMYNIKDNWMHHNPATGLFVVSNNYFRRGPSSEMTPYFLDAEYVGKGLGYYFDSNYVDDPKIYEGVLSPWASSNDHPSLQYLCSYFNGPDCRKFKLDKRPDFSNQEAYLAPTDKEYQFAYSEVLNKVGAFPRDIVTKATVDDVINRDGEWGARIPDDLMQGLESRQAPLDTDDDGLPDNWETKNGLDPNSPADQHTLLASGYSAIEQYINELADELILVD